MTADGAAGPLGTVLRTAALARDAEAVRSHAAAAPLRRVPRRRFPDPPFSANQAFDPPGRASVFTPDASMMLVALARVCGALRAPRPPHGACGRLTVVGSSVYRCDTRGLSCLGRRQAPHASTDTRTDIRRNTLRTPTGIRPIHAHCGGDARLTALAALAGGPPFVGDRFARWTNAPARVPAGLSPWRSGGAM